MIECRVVETPLDSAALISRASDSAGGAIAVFIGVARDSSLARGARVVRLEYEAYVPMALKQLQAISEEASERFGLLHAFVHHRIGLLGIGDAAVAIVVESGHRAEAFDACRYIIEELKQRVPIWKKEVFDDGAEWVSPRP